MTNERQVQVSELDKQLGNNSSFFAFNLLSFPMSAYKVATAFCEAAHLIIPAVRLKRQIIVTIGTSPFTVSQGQGSLLVDMQEPIINSTFGDFLFLDWQKMNSMPYEYIVATILEEMAHSLMNIKDEKAVRCLVATLYSGVRLSVDGRYESAR